MFKKLSILCLFLSFLFPAYGQDDSAVIYREIKKEMKQLNQESRRLKNLYYRLDRSQQSNFDSVTLNIYQTQSRINVINDSLVNINNKFSGFIKENTDELEHSKQEILLLRHTLWIGLIIIFVAMLIFIVLLFGLRSRLRFLEEQIAYFTERNLDELQGLQSNIKRRMKKTQDNLDKEISKTQKLVKKKGKK